MEDRAIRALIKKCTSHIPDGPEVIYRLTLNNGKYYVGRTNNIQRRFLEHSLGVGANWTKIHPPVSNVIVTSPLHKPQDEDAAVKEMMTEHGIDNVRGGSYCNYNLNDTQYDMLLMEAIRSASICAKCLRAGHMERQCRSKYAYTDKCQRCGDTDHESIECKSIETIYGVKIDKIKYCEQCGRAPHHGDRHGLDFCECKHTRDDELVTPFTIIYCAYCGENHLTSGCTMNNPVITIKSSKKDCYLFAKKVDDAVWTEKGICYTCGNKPGCMKEECREARLVIIINYLLKQMRYGPIEFNRTVEEFAFRATRYCK